MRPRLETPARSGAFPAAEWPRGPMRLFLPECSTDQAWRSPFGCEPITCSCSVGGPAAIDRQRYAGDRSCRFARQKDRERSQLFDRSEPLIRLLRQQHVTDHLLAWDTVRLRLPVDLCLNQRRVD